MIYSFQWAILRWVNTLGALSSEEWNWGISGVREREGSKSEWIAKETRAPCIAWGVSADSWSDCMIVLFRETLALQLHTDPSVMVCIAQYHFCQMCLCRILFYNINGHVIGPTLLEAMSETDRWVWIVSNWSRHQSSSSNVSPARWTFYYIRPLCPWFDTAVTPTGYLDIVLVGGFRSGEVCECRTRCQGGSSGPGADDELMILVLEWGFTCGSVAHWWAWCSCCERCAGSPRSASFCINWLNTGNGRTWAKGVTMRSSPCLGVKRLRCGLGQVVSTT